MRKYSLKTLYFSWLSVLIDFAVLPAQTGNPVVTLRQKRKAMNTYYNLPEGRLEEIKREASRFNEPWTKEERENVLEMFRNGMRVEEIAGTVHRTVNAIRIKLMEAGELVKALSRRGEPWTEEEENRLGRFYSQGYSIAGCAKLLGRLRGEAADKLVEIGLLPPQENSRGEHVVRDPAHPNAFAPWTKEESDLLQQELTDYLPALSALARIAENHGRTIGSILSRADKMGLCERIPLSH